jgi:hypothetical protein
LYDRVLAAVWDSSKRKKMADGGERALQRWERQQATWRRIEERISHRSGKGASETLMATTHHHRQNVEDAGMIETAVPAAVRNGTSSWEMGLRSGSNGVQYVRVGSTFPYPLYAPVRAPDLVSPDHPSLMHVLFPEDSAAGSTRRKAPISTAGYYQQRHEEFKPLITRKFAHAGTSEFFGVEGHAAPTTAVRSADEDRGQTIDPWQVVPAPQVHKAPVAAASAAAMLPRPLSSAAQRGLIPPPSSGTPSVVNATDSPGGPVIVLSAAHISLTAGPGATKQGTVSLDNSGSTAVFYEWRAVAPPVLATNAAMPPLSANACLGCFALSDVPSGVVLPGEAKVFCFAFRAVAPGIYTQQYELLTVPASRDHIVISLRGVVLADGVDAVHCAAVDERLDRRAREADAAEMLRGSLLLKAVGNALDAAEVEMAVAARTAEIEHEAAAPARQRVAWREKWERANRPSAGAQPKLPFCASAYEALAQIRGRCVDYELEVERSRPPRDPAADAPPLPMTPNKAKRESLSTSAGPRVATPTTAAAAEAQRLIQSAQNAPLAAEWSGSLRGLQEDARTLRSGTVRSTIQAGLRAICGALDCAAHQDDENTPLDALLWRAAGRQAFGAALDQFDRCGVVARALIENRSAAVARPAASAAPVRGGRSASGGGGASSALPSPANAQPGSAAGARRGKEAARPVVGSPALGEVNAERLVETHARRLVEGAIMDMIDSHARAAAAVDAATLVPLSAALPFDAVVPADAEAEALPDTTNKKRK